MVNLIRYLFGFVKIKIISEKPEILLNKLISSGISVWSTERRKDYILLCLSVKDYLKIRKLRKGIKVKSTVRIVAKKGIKQDIKKIKFRKSIAVGLIIVLIINIFLSRFIWVVDVTGLKELGKDEIVKECAKIGIKEGVFKRKIDTYDAVQKIALSFNEIAWVSVNIEGSKLTVNITESEESEKARNTSCNIIASIDGVIKSVKEIKGTKCVEVGQTVNKGDILISGVETVGNNVRYVFSKGEVLAETHRKFETKVYKKTTINTFSDNTEHRNVFEFFGIKIPLYLKDVDFNEKSFLKRKALMFNDTEIPIALSTRTFYIYDKTNDVLNEDEALNLAKSKFIIDIKDSGIIEIMTHNITYFETEKYYNFTLNLTCIEDIGETYNIEIPND